MADVQANSTSTSAIDAANEALASMQLSPDHKNDTGDEHETSTTPTSSDTKSGPLANGSTAKHVHRSSASMSVNNEVSVLRAELERTRAEKDTLDEHYRNLLERVTAMRTTLGNKLKQDAEELDRREQVIQSLTAENEDLSATISTLNSEFIASNDEAERLARELDALRNRTIEDSAYETSLRERDAMDLERVRLEKDEWETAAQEDRMVSEQLRAEVEHLKRELEMEVAEKEAQVQETIREKKTSANLQSVLEDFQAGKDREIRQAVGDLETQLRGTTNLLAEFKHRAYMAEEKLASSSTNAEHTARLEKEMKEKNLLIGKLRHEAVIINEHLTEALRRLRKSSSDTSVDRRLVTNVLLQFLVAARGDTKRFEMLGLLATVLGWTDDERERAGLQRVGSAAGVSASSAAPPIPGRRISSQSKLADPSKADESESFSKMWVEFLLKESASPTTPTLAGSTNGGYGGYGGPTCPPMSPLASTHSLGPLSPRGERRQSFQQMQQAPHPPPRSLRATSGPLPQPVPALAQPGAPGRSVFMSATSSSSAASSVVGDDLQS